MGLCYGMEWTQDELNHTEQMGLGRDAWLSVNLFAGGYELVLGDSERGSLKQEKGVRLKGVNIHQLRQGENNWVLTQQGQVLVQIFNIFCSAYSSVFNLSERILTEKRVNIPKYPKAQQ